MSAVPEAAWEPPARVPEEEVIVGSLPRIFLVLAAFGLLCGGAWAGPADQPRSMDDEVFERLQQGYQHLLAGKFNDAQAEFEKIIIADFFNPYANNNMAVLMEKQGRLVDAMTYLNIGEKFAPHYVYEGSTAYLIGGLSAAVNPDKTLGQTSLIAQVIAGNKKKLAEKMAPQTAGLGNGKK